MKLKIIIFLLICFFACNVFSQSEMEVLTNARSLVDKKSYAEALAKYESIANWLRRDYSTLIEWARVYTYADKHEQAINIFEEVCKVYPEHSAEILRELADQYKWSNQVAKSLDVYKQALKNKPDDFSTQIGFAQALAWNKNYKESFRQYDKAAQMKPESVEPLMGKAEVYGWIDYLEKAGQIYKKVLTIEPDNLNARNNYAKIMVWRGYYRKGIKLYEDIIRDNPNNLDAWEGMAFAYHWQGRDDKALESLDKLFSLNPQRVEAKKLYYNIKGSLKPYIAFASRYSYDKNKLEIFSHRARSGFHINQNSYLEVIDEEQSFRKAGQNPIQANRQGLGGATRLNDYTIFNAFLFNTNYDFQQYRPLTANSWLTIKPDDFFSIYLSFDRETFEDIQPLLNNITTKTPGISIDFRPNRWWFFSGQYKRSYYSDKNKQNTLLSKAEFRLTQKPYVKLYYNYYYTDWRNWIDSGYFNPNMVSAHSLGVYSGIDLSKKLFIEGQFSLGYEKQSPPVLHPVYYGAASINYRLSDNWLVGLRSEYFDARPDKENVSKGYSKKSLFLNITYSFDVGHSFDRSATIPSRPTTGQ